MQSGIDSLTSHANWRRLYELLPKDRKSPFFSPEYYLAYKEFDKAPAYCFWSYEDQDNFLFYPFLKKSINKLGYDLDGEYYDISGAYGYNGPQGVIRDRNILERFNQELLFYLASNNIVTEFVRYCPITENRLNHTYTEQIVVLDNVYIDLSKGFEWVWNTSMRSEVRTSVRKGESLGLRTFILRGSQISEGDVLCFYRIYQDTMLRKEVDKFYFFSYEFLLNLVHMMNHMVIMSFTFLDAIAISSELVLADGNLAFGFLLGTLSKYYNYKANPFQRWEITKYLVNKGVVKYSFGGGASRNDSIYSYKKGFAKNCDNPFYIGTKVHYPDVYEQIQAQWRKRFPNSAGLYSNKLQGYRFQS